MGSSNVRTDHQHLIQLLHFPDQGAESQGGEMSCLLKVAQGVSASTEDYQGVPQPRQPTPCLVVVTIAPVTQHLFCSGQYFIS